MVDLHGTLSQVEGLKSFVGRVDRASHLARAPTSSPIHRSAWRDCMKSGSRMVFRYSSRYEKTLPDGSIRCRMELHRASHAASFRTWPTEDPQPPRDPRRYLLHLEKRLPVASTPARLSSMAHRLLLLQKMAHRRYLGENQPGYPGAPASSLEAKSSAQCRRCG